jgi:hypothetical protein
MCIADDTGVFLINPALRQIAYLFSEGGGRVRAYIRRQRVGPLPCSTAFRASTSHIEELRPRIHLLLGAVTNA